MLVRKIKFLLPIIIFIALFSTLNLFSNWYKNKLQIEENKTIISELKAHATSIKESVNKHFLILDLLKSYISKNINSENIIDQNNIELNRYANTLFNSVEGIRALQVSPNGIHTFVYPIEGNEKTLNKNLFKDKRVEVIKMLEATLNSTKIITNSPYELRQGGLGLVARKSIRHNDNFWGFVIIVLDMGYILEKSGITENNNLLNISIFQDKRYIFGDKNILNNAHQSIPLEIANQNLSLIASKKESLDSITLLFINIAIFFISILSSFIIYILLNRQIKLESDVDKTLLELEYKNKELRTIIQEAPNPILLHKEGGEILIMNQAWSDASGYSFEEIPTIEDWINTVYVGEQQVFMKKHIGSLYEITEKIDEGEFTFYNKNKNKTTWQVSSAPLGLIDGKRTIITSAMDITIIKENEKIIFQQSKMASMGEMIGNIAHQWRQPLSIISMGSTGILMEKEFGTLDDETLIKNCNAINNNAQYLSKTIDDFRNFIKGDRTKVSFNLSDDINSFLELVKGAIKNNNINLVLDIKDDITINGYPNELIQCLINIFNNSKDALKENKIEDESIFISTFIEEENAIIKIKDNAGGIPIEALPRIFEPYFTTKHESQGTGLGLNMTYNLIVDGMKGSIKADNVTFVYENKEYIGAEFVITLPIS